MTNRLYFGLVVTLLTLGGFELPAQSAGAPSPTAALVRILDRGKWSHADVEAADRALRQGASLRAQSAWGVTLLMFAARAGDLPLMRRLLQAGVDVNAQTADGLTALWYVMATRNPEAVRFLLDHGAHPDLADSLGLTPLMRATQFQFRRGIELLIARGAVVNARNAKGYTALAYTDGHPGITALLRQRGAVE